MDENPTANADAIKSAAAAFLRDTATPVSATTPGTGGATTAENGNRTPAPEQPPAFTTQFIQEIKKEAVRESNAKLGFAATASISIAVFGLLLIGVIAILGYKKTIQPSKLIALSLIVISALLLIVLGYSDEQMSPVIGLLGTVAGYMLGSKEWDSDEPQKTVHEPPSSPP